MITYAVFDLNSGQIIATGGASTLETALLQGRQAGRDVILFTGAVDPRTTYVRDDAIVPRPLNPGFDRTCIAADGVDAARLDLGRPFSAVIDDTSHDVTDGVLEITAPMPATYTVQVSAFPYQDYEVEIIACA